MLPSRAEKLIAPGALLALLHFALGLRLLLDPRNIHDEGLSTYGFARSLADAFVPSLFFLKIRPALCLVYCLPARLGFDFFLFTHLLLGSLAVLLLERVARATGLSRPWLPALCLALSPLYLWSNATGISNASGVVAALLGLYVLEVRKHALIGGVVLGVLPFIRFEGAVFTLVLALHYLYRDRSARFLAGLLLFPTGYLLAGAVYHASLLWPVALPAGTTGLDPRIHAQELRRYAEHDLRSALSAVMMVSPAVPFAFLAVLRWPRLGPLERALLCFVSAYLLIFLVTHFDGGRLGPLSAVGHSPRNLLLLLGPAALLAGGLLEAALAKAPPRVVTLSLAAFAAFLALAPFANASAMKHEGYSTEGVARRRRFAEMTDALKSVKGSLAAHEIYTNNHTLALYLERASLLPEARVRYMVPADQALAIDRMTNRANGQTARLREAIPRATFGPVVQPEDLTPERVPEGTLFLLTNDPRTKLILPDAVWSRYLRALPRPAEVEFSRVCYRPAPDDCGATKTELP